MEANEMNLTTNYCTGCYQTLRPFSGCLCQPPCPPPPCDFCPPPRQNCCGFGGSNMLYFAIGYLIAKNNQK